MPRCRLIVDDWGNLSGKDAEFDSYDALEEAIAEACQLNGWSIPDLVADPAGNAPGLYTRTAHGLLRIAEPL